MPAERIRVVPFIYLSHEAELSGDAKLKDAQACPESAKRSPGDRKPGNGIRGPISRHEGSRGAMYEDEKKKKIGMLFCIT